MFTEHVILSSYEASTDFTNDLLSQLKATSSYSIS